MSRRTEQPVRPHRARCLLAPSVALLLLGAAPTEDVPALLRAKTERLLDAVTRGDGTVWAQELDGRARMVDESGAVSDKRTIVAGIRPLPPGVSGALRVTEFEATVDGDTAVTMYVSDETETFHGVRLHARYRTTDTWVKRLRLEARREPGARPAHRSAGGSHDARAAPGVLRTVRSR